MKVLFVGGTGQISLSCVEAALAQGHDVAVFNRGSASDLLPDGVTSLVGDTSDQRTYDDVGRTGWDVVCQFIAFRPDDIERDLKAFGGRVGQYIFISTASAYQKPVETCPITERVPLINPYWEYSRLKAAAEKTLRNQSDVPWTVVRPSHTVRTRLATALSEHDLAAQRMLAGKPVIVPGDGTSLWTLTRCRDFAEPFVRLFGKEDVLGEAYHLTSDASFTWDQIYQSLAASLGVEANIVHVPTDTLVRIRPEWLGPLLGDKSNTTVFDNSKIKSAVGDFDCASTLDIILEEPIAHYRKRSSAGVNGQPEMDQLLDRIIDAQRGVSI